MSFFFSFFFWLIACEWGLNPLPTIRNLLGLESTCGLLRSPLKYHFWRGCAGRFRKTPEHPYPAAFDDCFAVTAAIADSDGSELGIDPKVISVSGDSTGAAVAASIALAWRETNRPNLRSQVLVYPVLQMLKFNYPSYLELESLLGAVGSYPTYSFSFYLFGEPGFQEKLKSNSTDLLPAETWQAVHKRLSGETVDIPLPSSDIYPHAETMLSSRTSPLLAQNMSGVAPAIVFLSYFDMLRSEGEVYADRLQADGVEAVLDVYRWQTHGFAATPTLPSQSVFHWAVDNPDADNLLKKAASFVHRQSK